jgi:hypothetical protein
MIGRSLSDRHPFVATVIDGSLGRYAGSPLEEYYRRFQPVTAAEAIGLSPERAPGLADRPNAAYVMPWSDSDPLERLKKVQKWAIKEARQYGVNLDHHHGYSAFGPVSLEKGELEIMRLRNLCQSMLRSGYLRDDSANGDVGGRLLVGQDDEIWCINIDGGQHRVAVAAALGMTRIPMRISLVPIKSEEVESWQQVRNGVFTTDGALELFDRIMDGRPPELP